VNRGSSWQNHQDSIPVVGTAPSEVNVRQESLDAVYAQVFGNDEPGTSAPPSASRDPQPSDSGSVCLSDDQIINLAFRRRSSGAKFQSLWNGDWNLYFNSASEADSSVVFTLAYFTKDAAQIDRIFNFLVALVRRCSWVPSFFC